MSTHYYKILQISKTASISEIQEAYSQLIKKWQILREKQTPEQRERSEKVILFIEEAYKVLSDAKARALYDQTSDQAESTKDSATTKPIKIEQQPISPSLSRPRTRPLVMLVILLLVAGLGGYYVFFTTDNLFSNTYNDALTSSTTLPSPKNKPIKEQKTSQTEPTTPSTTQTGSGVVADIPPTQDSMVTVTPQNNDKLQSLDTVRLKNANNPKLKEMAKNLAELTNSHKDVIINANTQFLEAKASNQNVTLKFAVIDGITSSKIIFDAYLTERFFYDNGLCENQKESIDSGILFTFTYYNTQNQLIGKYYIDQQVCQSPMEKRLIKTPDKYQLDSIEIGEDGQPITLETNNEANEPDETIKEPIN